MPGARTYTYARSALQTEISLAAFLGSPDPPQGSGVCDRPRQTHKRVTQVGPRGLFGFVRWRPAQSRSSTRMVGGASV